MFQRDARHRNDSFSHYKSDFSCNDFMLNGAKSLLNSIKFSFMDDRILSFTKKKMFYSII